VAHHQQSSRTQSICISALYYSHRERNGILRGESVAVNPLGTEGTCPPQSWAGENTNDFVPQSGGMETSKY